MFIWQLKYQNRNVNPRFCDNEFVLCKYLGDAFSYPRIMNTCLLCSFM